MIGIPLAAAVTATAQLGAATATAQTAGAGGQALPLTAALLIFILAAFVGFEIITKIPPTLHTPLMSGSNAISGITLIGAITSAGLGHTGWTTALGFLAVVFATINVVGGFLVTHRMLEMFRGRGRRRRASTEG
ncbi:MAG: NAD(P) transhydrogenase subunit alpha [Planctomycetota bacterium]|nr:MAG: NAD(P) transhydrogenase subunit alpha [Planctomycetota bacterium]